MNRTKVSFNDEYYEKVLKDYGYRAFELEKFREGFGGLEQHMLNIRYLCAHRGDEFNRRNRVNRIITTGFGMSGPPHMATVSHILKMVEFQKNGENCQIVLGDMDAFNGKRRMYSEVKELAEKYAEYISRVGYLCNQRTLRKQDGYAASYEVLYFLGHYVSHNDFDKSEEDNHQYYADSDVVERNMTFRRSLSLALMASDFIVLGQTYDLVITMLGLDEHKYVRFTQDALSHFDYDLPYRADFCLGSIYTKMVPGLSGHPKFSKSIPGSSIGVMNKSSEIEKLLLEEVNSPSSSATYHLMCQIPFYSLDELIELAYLCRENGPIWRSQVRRFSEYLIELTELWPR